MGILTNRDLRFVKDTRRPVREVMTSENLITVPEGTTLEEAAEILHKHRIEKLLVVNGKGELRGLITVKDIQKKLDYPNACKDEAGRLRVAAAVGVGAETMLRAELLVEAGVDLLVVDTAHGHSRNVLDTVRGGQGAATPRRRSWPATSPPRAAAEALIEAGADAVKVGIGPGSICTTRVVAGVGVPQITAIMDVARVTRPAGIPLVADGGIRYSGDVAKAIAVGADCVMVGSLLAGTDESPGEKILFEGRVYKTYRGMGSLGAMQQGSKDRYFQGDDRPRPTSWCPRASRAGCPTRAAPATSSTRWSAACAAAWATAAAAPSPSCRSNAELVRVTGAGVRESHPHDVQITKEAPNYGKGV